MKRLTTTYSDHNDLLGALRKCLEKAGWTIHYFGLMAPTTWTTNEVIRNDDYTSTPVTVTDVDRRLGMWMSASKSGAYVVFRSIDGCILDRETYYKHSVYAQRGVVARVAEGFDPDKSYFGQPGLRPTQKCLLESGLGGKLDVFFSGDAFIATTTFDSNRYSSMSFGTLPVYVPGSGGKYLCSTHSWEQHYLSPLFSEYSPAAVYQYSFDTLVGWDSGNLTRSEVLFYLYADLDFPSNFYASSFGGMGNLARCRETAGGFPALAPVRTFVKWNGKHSPFAEFDDLFVANFELIEPGREFQIGQSRYVGFPYFRKSTASAGAVGNLGYVVRLDDE